MVVPSFEATVFKGLLLLLRNEHLHHIAAQKLCLEQFGKSPGLACADNLRGRLSDQPLKGSGHMWLIGIASLINGIQNRHSLFQERYRLLNTLDLVNVAFGKASGA